MGAVYVQMAVIQMGQAVYPVQMAVVFAPMEAYVLPILPPNSTQFICHNSCTSCKGKDSSQCNSCAVPVISYLAGNQPNTCNCVSSFYRDANTSYCRSCHSSCNTCTGPLIQDCLTCKNSTKTPINGFCLCDDRYFMNGAGFCMPCFPTCQKCTSAFGSSCSFCIPNAVLNKETGVCSCKDNYFSSGRGCDPVKCDSTCNTCTGPGVNQCSSCNADIKLLNKGFCPCSGNKTMNSSGYCVECDKTCTTCLGLSDSNCTTCKKGAILANNQKCICLPGYFQDISGGCSAIPCHFSCLECNDKTETSCINCGNNTSLQYDGRCSPNYGFYRPGNNTQVFPCFSSCATCTSGSFTSCSSCKNFAILNTDNTCTCLPGMASDFLGNCYNVTCHISCASGKCQGIMDTDCKACKSKAVLTIAGQCVCNRGNYMDGGGECQACSTSCLTCSGPSASDCTSCRQNAVVSSGICTPLPGFFLNSTNGIAMPCYLTCTSCKGLQIGDCLLCKDGASKFTDNNTCSCQTGLNFNITTSSCFSPACSLSCLTCDTKDPNKCTSCRMNSVLNNSKCICQQGFTDDGKGGCTAAACDKTCNTCFSGLTIHCTSCKDKAILDGGVVGPCKCIQGYYQNENGICIPCHPTCQACTNGTSQGCLSCRPNSYMESNNMCKCNDYYYLSSTSSSCEACHFTCLNCTSPYPSNCDLCKQPAVRNNATSICECPSDPNKPFTMRSDGQCVYSNQCHESCGACIGPSDSECISCNRPGSALINGYCLCISNQTTSIFSNLTKNSTMKDCLICDDKCAKCAGTSAICTSCPANAVPNNTSCICINGTFWNAAAKACVACHYSCLTCSNSSDSGCLSCNNTANLTSGKCLCAANANMYTDGSCRTCTALCDKCSIDGKCIVCKAGALLNLLGKCVCGKGYFMNSYNCEPCDPLCDSCFGSFNSSCLTCRANETLTNGICYCIPGASGQPPNCTVCSPGSFYDSRISNCSSCLVDNCITCSSQSVCTFCSFGYQVNSAKGCSVVQGGVMPSSNSSSSKNTSTSASSNTSQTNSTFSNNTNGTGLAMEGDLIYYQQPFVYSLEIINDQILVYVQISLSQSELQSYIKSIARDDLLSIKNSNGSPVTEVMNWNIIPESVYEWGRGVVRFHINFSHSAESFVSNIELRPVLLPTSAEVQSRLLEATASDKAPKNVQIPSFTVATESTKKVWYFVFSAIYCCVIMCMFFLIFIRPFNKSLRNSVRVFWIAQNIMWFQVLFLFGFLAVDFRGYLDEVLFNLSSASLRYFGADIEVPFIANIQSVRNGYYLGKYTGKDQTPYVFQKMFIPLMGYFLMWALSALPLGSSRDVIIAMRSGIGFSYGIQFAFMCTINLVAFVQAAVFTPYTIVGSFAAVVLIILLWTELILLKMQLVQKKRAGRLLVLKNKGLAAFDSIGRTEEQDSRDFKFFPLGEADCLLLTAMVIGATGRNQFVQPILLTVCNLGIIGAIVAVNQQFKLVKRVLALLMLCTQLSMFVFLSMKAEVTLSSINFMVVIFIVLFLLTLATNALLLCLRLIGLLKQKISHFEDVVNDSMQYQFAKQGKNEVNIIQTPTDRTPNNHHHTSNDKDDSMQMMSPNKKHEDSPFEIPNGKFDTAGMTVPSSPVKPINISPEAQVAIKSTKLNQEQIRLQAIPSTGPQPTTTQTHIVYQQNQHHILPNKSENTEAHTQKQGQEHIGRGLLAFQSNLSFPPIIPSPNKTDPKVLEQPPY